MGYEPDIKEDGTIIRNNRKSLNGIILIFEIAWILSVLILVAYFCYAFLNMCVYVEEINESAYVSFGDDYMPSCFYIHLIITVILIILKIVKFRRDKEITN